MTTTSAFREGFRRVNRAPSVVMGMFLVTLMVALPLSLALRGMIEAQLGTSLVADSVASGVNYDWWQEFSAQAAGLGKTFGPSLIGFGAVLQNLSGLLDNVPLASTIAGATAGVARHLVVPERRRPGSLRARSPHAHGRFFCRVRHAFLALLPPRRNRLVRLRVLVR